MREDIIFEVLCLFFQRPKNASLFALFHIQFENEVVCYLYYKQCVKSNPCMYLSSGCPRFPAGVTKPHTDKSRLYNA